MSRDQRRQVAIVVSFLITLAINIAANALPINGQRTAEISDRFDVFVIPAGYVFSIWGLIYLLLAAFTIHQARPSRSTDPTLRRLGWLPVVAGILNATSPGPDRWLTNPENYIASACFGVSSSDLRTAIM